MGNIFHDDFRDFVKALNNQQVKYLLVGGYSVVLHGYARNTGDIDIWVNPTIDNYMKLVKSFHDRLVKIDISSLKILLYKGFKGI